jgi:hypothetical protein
MKPYDHHNEEEFREMGASFLDALSTLKRNKAGRQSLFRLQEVVDSLGETPSEVFFELLYDQKYPARRLWLALGEAGIKCHYHSVLKWRKLHRAHKLVFPNGKVQMGDRS